MSQSGAQRRAIQAVAEGSAITPMGFRNAQEGDGYFYSAIPAPLPRSLGIEQGDELVYGYHAPSDTWMVSPVEAVDTDHWASQFVD